MGELETVPERHSMLGAASRWVRRIVTSPAVRKVADPVLRRLGRSATDAGRRAGAVALDGTRRVAAHPLVRRVAGPVVRPVGTVVRRAALGPGPMRVRAGGRDVPVSALRIAAAFPGASAYLVVLVPGRDGDDAWWRPAHRPTEVTDGVGGPAEEADREDGRSEVWVRYDGGRHLTDNGRELARLLTELVDAWPVPVERITLIGHGTGGLVAQSAVRHAAADAHAGAAVLSEELASEEVVSVPDQLFGRNGGWAELVGEVVCVASDEDRLLAWGLRETRAGAGPAGGELWHGYLDEREWEPVDPGGLPAVRRTGIRRAVAGRAGANSREGYWVGELLVLPGGPERGPLARWRAAVRRAWSR